MSIQTRIASIQTRVRNVKLSSRQKLAIASLLAGTVGAFGGNVLFQGNGWLTAASAAAVGSVVAVDVRLSQQDNENFDLKVALAAEEREKQALGRTVERLELQVESLVRSTPAYLVQQVRDQDAETVRLQEEKEATIAYFDSEIEHSHDARATHFAAAASAVEAQQTLLEMVKPAEEIQG
jgi:hypothetical protein